MQWWKANQFEETCQTLIQYKFIGPDSSASYI